MSKPEWLCCVEGCDGVRGGVDTPCCPRHWLSIPAADRNAIKLAGRDVWWVTEGLLSKAIQAQGHKMHWDRYRRRLS